jgi:hypothetical protein
MKSCEWQANGIGCPNFATGGALNFCEKHLRRIALLKPCTYPECDRYVSHTCSKCGRELCALHRFCPNDGTYTSPQNLDREDGTR